MTRRPLLILAVATCAVLAGACDPMEFNIITVPPTSKVGALNDHTVHVSKGVALAIECHDPKDDEFRTCGPLRARSQDPSQARAFVADIDEVFASRVKTTYGGFTTRNERRSVFVIAGVAPGKTHVEIDTRRGTESFAVFISP